MTSGPARGAGPGRPSRDVQVWPCGHNGGPGVFDETARRASHEELAVAMELVAEGHRVRTVAERRGTRTPDLMACGTSVEVKSFQSIEERAGRPPRPQSVANKLLDARGQGSIAVLWAGRSGLDQGTVKAGYSMFLQKALREGIGRLRAARVVGPGLAMSFNVVADMRACRQARQVPAPGHKGPRSAGPRMAS